MIQEINTNKTKTERIQEQIEKEERIRQLSIDNKLIIQWLQAFFYAFMILAVIKYIFM